MADLTVALAGNPNAGKSTLFNALTGLRQHTGNWPGKTVECKTGTCSYAGLTIELVDLPGTYSLAAYSPDEIAARDYIIGQRPDAVICVLDATNLERNLYLAVQLLELGVPVVAALNMSDQARGMGIAIDGQQLSHLLGDVPVVPTTASRGEGLESLLAAILQQAQSCCPKGGESQACHCQCANPAAFQVSYGRELGAAIDEVSRLADQQHLPLNGACSRWLALKLLEGEQDMVQRVGAMPGGGQVVGLAQARAADLVYVLGDDVDMVAADYRYGVVSGISRQVVRRPRDGGPSLTERIDRLVAHRLLGLPIFMAVMYLVFRLVIDVSAPFLDWVDGLFTGPVTAGLSAVLVGLGAADWLQSLVLDGIVAGVGGVLTFVPGLIALFFFLALLEDSGYMARAAFVMDRLMQFVGLHGKSVIPLMLGFGCAVPAVYATRTIASRRDRLLTALLIPFMSCSARLPVYVVFAMAFFGARAGTVIWLMYVIGIAVAIAIGLIFSRTLLKPEGGSAFVLELPPYRMPTLKSLSLHTWDNTREFVRKAGTVILAVSVLLWLLLNLPWGVADQRDSLYGQVTQTIAPALAPAGFGEWEASGALMTGFIAKELVVSSLAQIYTGADPDAAGSETSGQSPASIGSQLWATVVGFGQAAVDSAKTLISLLPGINLDGSSGSVEDTTLSQALEDHFSPLAAFAFLVFVLLYIPCVATVGAIKQEFGGRWAVTSAVYQTAVAWLAAVLVYQGGRFLGLG